MCLFALFFNSHYEFLTILTQFLLHHHEADVVLAWEKVRNSIIALVIQWHSPCMCNVLKHSAGIDDVVGLLNTNSLGRTYKLR